MSELSSPRRGGRGSAGPAGAGAGPRLLAVLPFAYLGAPEFSYLGAGLVDLLALTLEDAERVRVVDPSALLAYTRTERRARVNNQATGARVARHFGADGFVLGSVIEVRERLRLSATVYPRRGAEPLVRAEAEGCVLELPALIDDLARQVLAGCMVQTERVLQRLAARTTSSLPALRAYLEGEEAFRASRLAEAAAALQRAVAIDPDFALAYYRLAIVQAARVEVAAAQAAAEQGISRAHSLPRNERLLLKAQYHFRRGDAGQAEALQREVLASAPEHLEARSALAETLFHYAVPIGEHVDACRQAFESVLEVEPDAAEPLLHLARLAGHRGDAEELERLTARLAGLELGDRRLELDAIRAFQLRDAEAQADVVARLAAADLPTLVVAAIAVLQYTTNAEGIEPLLGLFRDERRDAETRGWGNNGMATFHVAFGRWDAAQPWFRAAQERSPAHSLVTRAYTALLPHVPSSDAELREIHGDLDAFAAAAVPVSGHPVLGLHNGLYPYIRAYLLGRLEARLGTPEAAERWAARLRERSHGLGGTLLEALPAAMASGVLAEVAARRGDAEGALRELDGGWLDVSYVLREASPIFYQLHERMRRVEWLRALGRDGEALDALRTFDGACYHNYLCRAAADLAAAELLEKRGDAAAAAERRTRAARMWSGAEPPLRRLLDGSAP